MSDDYNDHSVSVLKGVEPVRAHPGLYSGDVETIDGPMQICKEVYDNSLDEAGEQPNRKQLLELMFHFDDKGGFTFICKDQGRGVPLKSIETLFGTLHASAKSGEGYKDSTIGIFGLGASVSNALSEIFCVTSCRQEGSRKVVFKESVATTVDENNATVAEEDYGTTTILKPDHVFFPRLRYFREEGGLDRIIEQIKILVVFIPNLELEISLLDKTIPNKFILSSSIEELQTRVDGLKKKLLYKSDPDVSPLTFIKSYFNIKSTVKHSLDFFKPQSDGFGYDVGIFVPDTLVPWKSLATINSILIDDYDSHHIAGVVDALKTTLGQFIENKQVARYFKEVYRLPIISYICAKYKGASFINQTKDRFKKKEFYDVYKQHLIESMVKVPIDTWQSVFDCIEDDLELKYSAYVNKDLGTNKSFKQLNTALNDPKLFHTCISDNPDERELFIVEGKSAGGNVAEVRNKQTQAVFKLKGKPSNPLNKKEENIFVDKTVKDLAIVIGVSPTDTNLDNLKFKKGILPLADADDDGGHILILTCLILYKINPLIISEGKVLIPNPPLYSLVYKSSRLFLKNELALADTRIKEVYSKVINIEVENTITNKSTILTGEAFRDFCYLIKHLHQAICITARNLALQPAIFEQLVYCMDYIDPVPDTKKLREVLALNTVDYNGDSKTLVLSVDFMDVTVTLEAFIKAAKEYILPMLNKVYWDKLNFYIINAEDNKRKRTSIVHLAELFGQLDKYFTIRRFKGIGELDPEDLQYTCLNPDTRKLLPITALGDIDFALNMLGVDSRVRKVLVTKL